MPYLQSMSGARCPFQGRNTVSDHVVRQRAYSCPASDRWPGRQRSTAEGRGAALPAQVLKPGCSAGEPDFPVGNPDSSNPQHACGYVRQLIRGWPQPSWLVQTRRKWGPRPSLTSQWPAVCYGNRRGRDLSVTAQTTLRAVHRHRQGPARDECNGAVSEASICRKDQPT